MGYRSFWAPIRSRRYGLAGIPAPPVAFVVLLSRYPRRLGDALQHPPHLGEVEVGDVEVFHAQGLEDRAPPGRIGGYLVLQGGKGGLDVALALLNGLSVAKMRKGSPAAPCGKTGLPAEARWERNRATILASRLRQRDADHIR
jgi:hypothetical protein